MKMNGRDRGGRAPWNPSADSLSFAASADGSWIALSNVTVPFTASIAQVDEASLFAAALAYVEQANERVDRRVPAAWIAALHAEKNYFGWCPIWEAEASDEHARGASFWVRRDAVAERTLVLVAAERLGAVFINSGIGLRVTARVIESEGVGEAHFVSLVAKFPVATLTTEENISRVAMLEPLYQARLGASRATLARSMGMDPDSLVFSGMTITGGSGASISIDISGACTESSTPVRYRLPHRFVARAKFNPDAKSGEPLEFSVIERQPMVADADSPVLPMDPASSGKANKARKRRPTREEKLLRQFRKKIGPPAQDAFVLEDVNEVRVLSSAFVRKDPAGNVRKVDLAGTAPSVRSNDFSAVSAYWHFHRMLKRLTDYGFALPTYFRMAKLPIDVFYRSGIRPGPGKDGQAVNARVLPEGWPPDFYRPPSPLPATSLQVHLALGNRSTRARPRRVAGRVQQAEPLGIALDARWMWHEFGHVLLMASVGELEFRFAHSAGDALAAIASDPLSQLADDPRARFATFPWVSIPRRHDRCVAHGWSWCGSMHRAVRTQPRGYRRKGYRSEQILSSTLFRTYLCLGGNTPGVAGRPAREAASHYALYLIIKAISLLGDAGKVPTEMVEGFLLALIDADATTLTFSAALSTGASAHWVGGCAMKPLRWAFEAQGLFAADPDALNSEPGLPPSVDIYVEDRRPLTEPNVSEPITHRPGGYVPVALDATEEIAAWHSAPGAIDIQNDGVRVTVKNRGQNSANAVSVQLWWIEWPLGNALPDWNANGWIQSGTNVVTQAVPADQQGVTFGPFDDFAPTQGKRYALVAIATCADDLSIADQATLLACSSMVTPLVQLVTGDNNVGLLIWPTS